MVSGALFAVPGDPESVGLDMIFGIVGESTQIMQINCLNQSKAQNILNCIRILPGESIEL